MEFDFDTGQFDKDDELDMLVWEAITACNAVWQIMGCGNEDRENFNRVLRTILCIDTVDDA